MKKLVSDFLTELYRRNRVLTVTALLMIAIFVVIVFIAPFDKREVMGINPWIKPIKFTLSIALFVGTLAWFSPYVSHYRKTLKVITWCVAIAMTVEIICIVMQAGRGTTSHYNISTLFNTIVFQTMGNMIVLNSIMIFLMLILFFMPQVELPTAYLWGIRLGLLMLLIASAQGGMIISNNAHTVGLPDGGEGLPFVNWSTKAGDLRVAHFMGLHGLQAFPLVGYFLSKRESLSQNLKTAVVFLFAFGYFAVFIFVLKQALNGKSLLSLLV